MQIKINTLIYFHKVLTKQDKHIAYIKLELKICRNLKVN